VATVFFTSLAISGTFIPRRWRSKIRSLVPSEVYCCIGVSHGSLGAALKIGFKSCSSRRRTLNTSPNGRFV